MKRLIHKKNLENEEFNGMKKLFLEMEIEN